MKQQVLFIVGPTAVGKTSLSIDLAQRLNGEIISGDSMQVYRHLDIGTAKVTKLEMQGVTHHLINVCDVDQRYSVANFCQDAANLIDQISARGKLPIVVGGTGFYIQALLYGLNLGGDHYQDDQIRTELSAFADQHGNYALWKRLEQVDVQAARTIPVPNRRRVIRALEVYLRTGKKFSDQNDHMKPRYDAFMLGLNTERQLLYRRIDQRVDLMLKDGLLDEARWLFDRGGLSLPAGKGIGYRELDAYFQNKMDLSQAVEEIKKDSRHYAKRQLTWFRNKLDVKWYDIILNSMAIEQLKVAIKDWLK